MRRAALWLCSLGMRAAFVVMVLASLQELAGCAGVMDTLRAAPPSSRADVFLPNCFVFCYASASSTDAHTEATPAAHPAPYGGGH